MPRVASVQALVRAAAGFQVAGLELAAEPAAVAAALPSVEESGLLLLGEVHGVRENPLLARTLMRALGLNRLALEWPAGLAPVIAGYLAAGTPADHQLLWGGDGRITAGHLSVLARTRRGRAAAGDLVRRGRRRRLELVAARCGDGRADPGRRDGRDRDAGSGGERAHSRRSH